MYLKQNKIGGRTHLIIAHGYRDRETKKVRTKTIKSIGYLDALEKEYADPVSHFKQVVKEMNEKEKTDNSPAVISFDKSVALSNSSGRRKNLGYAVLSKIYHELGMKVFWGNNSQNLKTEFNVNNIMKTEIFSRILFPGSKKKTYDNRKVFFENTDYELADVYRYVLDDSGYVWLNDEYKIKSRLHPRTVYVTDVHGKQKQARLDEKQVIFYSKAYDKKAKADRGPSIIKAHDLISNPSKYKKATSYGAAKYVKNIEYDPKTGEILTSKHKPVFNEQKLRDDEKWDGYYAIVTSELDKTDSEIIEIYRGLWKIEESFKVTKSDFETRPVYLSRKDHIEAHFLICFIALVIVRILEKLLGYKFSASRLAETLNRVSCSPLEENWYLFDYADDVTAEIKKTLGIDLTRKYLCLGDIKKNLADTKKP